MPYQFSKSANRPTELTNDARRRLGASLLRDLFDTNGNTGPFTSSISTNWGDFCLQPRTHTNTRYAATTSPEESCSMGTRNSNRDHERREPTSQEEHDRLARIHSVLQAALRISLEDDDEDGASWEDAAEFQHQSPK